MINSGNRKWIKKPSNTIERPISQKKTLLQSANEYHRFDSLRRTGLQDVNAASLSGESKRKQTPSAHNHSTITMIDYINMVDRTEPGRTLWRGRGKRNNQHRGNPGRLFYESINESKDYGATAEILGSRISKFGNVILGDRDSPVAGKLSRHSANT
jgi:hypothetical protein